MKVLVIGSNGREHALAETYAKSKKVTKVFLAPGNGLSDFTNKKIKNVPLQMTDIDDIVRFCKKEKIDLVDVPQDDCLAAGYVDILARAGIKAFGPTQKASQIEWSKQWARDFMVKYKLPIPHFKSFNNTQKAIRYVKSLPEQLLYIKASGLALGKGAIRAETKEQAIDAIKSMKQFGRAGETFLIEEGLTGEEFSLFAICDGKNYIITKAVQDHKTIYNADKGQNTGGIGCVSPTRALSKKLIREIEIKIIKPVLKGMENEGRPYTGILYLGGIITTINYNYSSSERSSSRSSRQDGYHMVTSQARTISDLKVKIIEFNARWGDPEAEVILPSIKTDYINIVQAATMEQLNNITIKFDNKVRVSVAGCSQGYPNDYSKVKGKEIFGLQDSMKLPGITVYGSGIKRIGNRFFANGGRIFHVVAEGKDIQETRRLAYSAMSLIYIEGNNLHFRTDIGWRELERRI